MEGKSSPRAEPVGLIRGTGAALGPLVTGVPWEERTLHHVLGRRVAERPGATWLVFDGHDRLTFSEAQTEMHRFARALAARGFAGAHVALFLRNQVEFIPAFMGAQAAGGVAAPLNPELRGPLLEQLLGRCAARVLVARADLLERLTEIGGVAGVELVVACGEAPDAPARIHGAEVVTLDAFLDGHTSGEPPAPPVPEDVGALMFTSGTSGGSKAAIWSHRYLHFSSACVTDSLGHAAGDVLSTPLQMCHVAGLTNFANSALQAGCVAHLKSRFSASSWWAEIAEDGATFAMLMGQMAAMVLEAVPEAPPHQLRNVYILPQPAGREEFERRYGTHVIWQGWGMTEIFPHTPVPKQLHGVPADTIGPAPDWVDFGIVGEDDRLLPPGTIGELVYRPLLPDAMARGYFGDAETTVDAFRNFMFHTGDLAYYDEEGRMHFVMRKQDRIRRLGENISAVELEAIAAGHPAVREAAAYGVPAAWGEHEVKLDVVADDGIDLDALHVWLRDVLPRYMVPRYLERRAALPRTPSQRVEKYKLAADGLDRPAVREYDLRARR